MGKKPVNRRRGPKPQHHPDYVRLRTLLRQWRADAGLTQREVADRLRRPQSYVAKVERGSPRVNPVEWLAFLAVLGITPDDAVRALRRAS